MMSSAQTATSVHEADLGMKALFHDFELRVLRVRASRVAIASSRLLPRDVLLDLLASCDRDIYAETVAAQGHDPLAVS